MNENPKNKHFLTNVDLIANNFSLFQEAMHSRRALKRFLKDSDQALTFLSALCQGDKVMLDSAVAFFCAQDTVLELCKKGKVEDVWHLIMGLDEDELQYHILSKPEVVYIFSAYGKAQASYDFISKELQADQCYKLLKIPYAVFGLCKYGDAEQLAKWIEQHYDVDRKVAVYSTAQALYGLTGHLPESGLCRLLSDIEELTGVQQTQILSADMAVFGLVKIGKTAYVLSLLKQLTEGQKEIIRNASYVRFILTENVAAEDLSFFIKDIPQKRQQRKKQELISDYKFNRKQ